MDRTNERSLVLNLGCLDHNLETTLIRWPSVAGGDNQNPATEKPVD